VTGPERDRGGVRPTTGAEATVGWATRRLLHAETPDEVREVLLAAVERLGGSVVPASEADDDGLPVDVSLGLGPPMLPVAEPHSVARLQLERHLPALAVDARHALDTLARAERLSRDAGLDPLTRLGNRATFDRLMRRLEPGDVVVAIDIDGLKAVNDTRGHAAGDELLRAFAACLQEQVRVRDHAFRLGGDEFVVVLVDSDVASVEGFVDRLRAAWRRRRVREAGFSAGIAPVVGSGDEAGRAADEALYAAKAAGGDTHRLAPGR